MFYLNLIYINQWLVSNCLLLTIVNGGISTGRTSSTITMCEQGHPQHRSSLSNSSVSSIKSSHLVVIGGTPPPPYDVIR